MFSASAISLLALATQTFNGSTTWVAPQTTTAIKSAVGYGAAGTPAGSTTTTTNVTHTIKQLIRKDGGSDNIDEGYTDGWPPGGSSYCDNTIVYPDGDSTIYYGEQTCYYPETQSTTTSYPATPGDSATAFGCTFPGGDTGSASTTTINNISITPLGSYSIVVPGGGSLTITYYK